MSETDGGRWQPEKPAKSAERHSSDLKKVNDKLRELIDSLRNDRERHAGKGPAQAPQSAPSEEPAGLAPDRMATELTRVRVQAEDHRREAAELRERLTEVEQESRRVYEEAQAVQEQASAIANLYATLFRIHCSLDRDEVLQAIQEIVINIVGSEEMAVLERSSDGQHLDVARTFGIEPQRVQRIAIGTGEIGRIAERGEIYIAEGEGQGYHEGHLTACIPLKLGNQVTGVVAIFRLLGQKAGITAADREVFELLKEQGARSLYLAKLHQAHSGS